MGGEWSGAALLAVETAKPGRRAWAAMWPQLGAPFGFCWPTALSLALLVWLDPLNATPDLGGAFLTWGWRIPFLLSAVMVAIGLYVRLKLTETPVFARAVERGERVKTPVARVFRSNWRQLILGTFVMLSTYTIFYIVTTWALSYGTAKEAAGRGGAGLQLHRLSEDADDRGAVVRGDDPDRRAVGRPLGPAQDPADGDGGDHGLRRAVLGDAHTRRASYGSVLAFLIIGMTLMGFTFGPMSAVLPGTVPRPTCATPARAFPTTPQASWARRWHRSSRPGCRRTTGRLGRGVPAVRRDADVHRTVDHARDPRHSAGLDRARTGQPLTLYPKKAAASS